MADVEQTLKIGVSACLLGEKVRFDGGHKRDRFVTDILGDWVEYVPVCPEVEMGLGTPRPSIRLEKYADEIRLVESRSRFDHTDKMRDLAAKRVSAIAKMDLCGYILKSKSPSCGMERVQLWNEKGMVEKTARGLFAQRLIESLPLLPIEEEGRLNDSHLRENFVERLFAYQRLHKLLSGKWSIGRLVAFHTVHKLQLMAHSPADYRRLGKVVAQARDLPRAELRQIYEVGFMSALARQSTPGRNVNVLQHMAGYFRKDLPSGQRQELAEHIEDYGKRLVPLVVPLTLVRHHARRLQVDYLQGQTYLEPHPRELMLRNHV